jgi:hypothetical protein
MYAKVVGSSPTLPTIMLSNICITILAESTIKVTIGNLIEGLKGNFQRKWFSINIIITIMALCGICRELAQ